MSIRSFIRPPDLTGWPRWGITGITANILLPEELSLVYFFPSNSQRSSGRDGNDDGDLIN